MTLLIIDLGSSSVRALLFNAAAQPIHGAIHSRPCHFDTDSSGRATADPQTLQRLTETCIDDILRHPAADHIRAVGLATFAGNWLGLDAQGQACTPVLTYADTAAAAEIPALRQKLGAAAAACHQATGCLLHSAYLPAQYAGIGSATSPPRPRESNAYAISAAISIANGSPAISR